MINLNDTLRRWWPALIPAVIAVYHSLSPSLATYVSAHPKASVWIAAGIIFVQTLFHSPLQSDAVNASQGSQLADAMAKARKGL